MHDFKACQNFHSSHLWNRGSCHWLICIYVTLIVLCHLFYILIELPCCFYFQIAPWCFLNGTNSTAKAPKNSTANRYKSVKISCCKVPLIYFSISDCISQWSYIMLSPSSTGVELINSSKSIALKCHLFRGSQISTPRPTIFSLLVFQAMCYFSRTRSQKHKFPRLWHF